MLSQLDAVNVALQTIGESPVNSISPAPTPSAAAALRIVDEATDEVLSAGYRFNRERDVVLSPDVGGEIVLVDVVSVSGERFGRDLVLRGTRLFDLDRNSYTFAGAVTVELLRLIPWEEIPQTARLYIARRAGRLMQDRFFKDRTRSAIAQREELEARLRLDQEEARGEPFTFLEQMPQARIKYSRRRGQ